MPLFSTRTAALRSLMDISADAVKHAKDLILERNDGRFYFDEDQAEQFLNTQDDITNAHLENTMTTEITLENVKTASTKELVEFYNLYVESSIKKFRDRATAERKCQEILDEIAKQDAETMQPDSTDVEQMRIEAEVAEAKTTVYGFEDHGFVTCPSCGMHLSNGVGIHGDEVNGKVIRHDSKHFACLGCGAEFGPAIASKKASTSDREVSATQAETMKTTLKLDRTIIAAPAGEAGKLGEWKNSFQMYKANPTWMTSAQQDGLTAKLYKAAKEGKQITVEINLRKFQLKNV